MKKIIIGLVLPLAVALSSCSEFLDINNDPNYPTSAKAIDLLPSGQVATAAIAGGEMELVGSIWSRYYTQNPSAQQYTPAMGYVVTTSSYNSFWRDPYTNSIKNLVLCRDKAKAEGRANIELMAKVMIAFNFHLITDWYGDVPFNEAINGSDIRHPKYDDSKEVVYPGMIKMLDEAIALNDAARKGESPAAADMVYAGDVAKWVAFAKTLKLKLLMRDFEANKAAITALLNEGNLLVADAGIVGKFIDEYAKSNPLFESDRRELGSKNNLRLCATWADGVVGATDPRLASVGETDTVGVFAPLPYASTDKDFASSRARLAATDNVYFISEVESYFLQAEAWVRLNDNAKAKASYDAAVGASFARANKLYAVYSSVDNNNEKLKAAMAKFIAGFTAAQLDGSSFLAVGGAYYFDAAGASADLLNLVLTQKWVAAARFQAWDAYFDINRTGVPASVFTVEDFPKRMPYPDLSLQYNNNAPKSVPSKTTKLWWQK